MKKLSDYFVIGAEDTASGRMIGMEIETDFFDDNNRPISERVCSQILALDKESPSFCTLKLELGRQKLELNIAPERSFELVYEKSMLALDWLYGEAAGLGAHPVINPEYRQDEALLFVQEERDRLWVDIDSAGALEHLCRCSSVQYIVDVAPHDAISWVNVLNAQLTTKVNEYGLNDLCWRRYIEESAASYGVDRYGGPRQFQDLTDYVRCLAKHRVVMHQSEPAWLLPADLDDLDINLFLRSVWWHYRLRRYGEALCVEMRPFPRVADAEIPNQWRTIASVLGL